MYAPIPAPGRLRSPLPVSSNRSQKRCIEGTSTMGKQLVHCVRHGPIGFVGFGLSYHSGGAAHTSDEELAMHRLIAPYGGKSRLLVLP